MNPVLNHCDENSPYLLKNEAAYQAWRSCKLESRRQATPLRVFTLNADGRLADSQMADVQQQIDAHNFVIFEAPYTNRAMNWHTDGYYNPHARRINAFSLYCVNQSARGGGNFLFDHEMMYLLIRDQSPELLEALMHDDLMRIPANVQDNQVIRAEESGPVFSLQPISCALNMRFTSRPQHIVWKSDKCSQQALNRVREILMQGQAMIEIRLHAGQGIVCNNILHGREAFQDDPQHPARLVYRARYYDAIDFERDFAAQSTP